MISFVGSYSTFRAGAAGTFTIGALAALSNDTGGASAVEVGDYVIVVWATGATADRNPATPTCAGVTFTDDLTDLYVNGTSYDTNLRVWGGFVHTAPTGVVTISESGSSLDGLSYAIFAFRGVDPDNPIDVPVETATGTGTGRPDPPAADPASLGVMVVACYANAAGTGTIYTRPANLSSTTNHWQAKLSPDTNDGQVGVGLIPDWSDGTVDPDPITAGGTTGAGDSWAAATILLRPVDAVPVAAGGKMKVWDGAWAEKPVKVWDGAWVEKPVKVFNGLDWVLS